MPSLAEIAYNAYGDSRGWVTFNGDPMPRWEDQGWELQNAWNAAAQAVAAVLIDGSLSPSGESVDKDRI